MPAPNPIRAKRCCASPSVALADAGSYSLSLAPGSWVLWGFYEDSISSGAFLGAPQAITVSAGGTVVADVTVPYAKPATVDATVSVSGLPAGVLVDSASVVICPVGVAYDGISQPLPCASSQGGPSVPTSGPVSVTLTELPPGQWTAYPSYCTEFGCSTPTASPKTVVTVAGRTTTAKLTTPYQVPPTGLVNASVVVTGAPAGFSDPTGVDACQISFDGTSCEGIGGGTGPDPLFLTDGTWLIAGYYTVSPFENAITGPEEIVNVQGGQTTSLTFAVPYQVLGGVTGSIKISGRPGGVRPTGYTVSACPAGNVTDPLDFLSCVYESSGSAGYYYGAEDIHAFGRSAHRGKLHEAAGTKLNSVDLPTLTPGQWDVTVGYSTLYGSFYPEQNFAVNVTAGAITKAKFTVPYEAPAEGVVTGSVKVADAPNGEIDAGVTACSTEPTAGTCTDEVDGQLNSDGTYQLPLFPGTWWVEGVDYVYTGETTTEITSTPRQETVVAGQRIKANFTVVAS